jgi:FtsP/CotA-like multicopper oxidase with cupredoxin domain
MRKGAILAVTTVAAVAAVVGTPSATAQLALIPKQGMVCTAGPTFSLTARTGYNETPDGNSILMWSYAVTGGAFQSPGPVLCVTQGDTVTVNLHNTLPEPVSVIFPGQEGVTGTGAAGLLTAEAPSGGDATYTFVAGQPGTYLYQSGSDQSKQVEMGLYGALIVRPAGHADYAYDAPTQFNAGREYLVLLAEIDPDLHAAVETGGTYDFTAVHNRYFTVNGREFPDTIADNGVSWLPGQPYGALIRIQPYDPARNPLPALIRMINVGVDNHPFHPHGNHLSLIAQDGRLFRTPVNTDASSEHFAETIGSGQTEDFLLKWTDQDSWDAATNPFPANASLPTYRNLTFKDNNTWFSGSPYLGSKGTLPNTVTSQNLCGEWYFPWHSHALNEFANFDAGFGGMATLLRVDPLDGCTGYATGTTVSAGSVRGGTFTALGATDTTYYQVNSTVTGTRAADWNASFAGVPTGSVNAAVTYVGRTCTTAATATTCPSLGSLPVQLSAWNWVSSSWTPLGAATPIGNADTTVTRALPVPNTPFIGTGSNAGKMRIRVVTTGAATNFVTQANRLTITFDGP